MENLNMQSNAAMMENSEFEEKVNIDDLVLPSKLIDLAEIEIDDIKQEPIEEEKKPAIFESYHDVAVGKKIKMEENILKLYEELDKEKSENSIMDFSLRRSLKIRQLVEKAFEDKSNEPLCFLCQEYEIDIGHQTSSCPKKYCKICHQRGHFAMNCKTFCKDFVTKDEQMVKLEDETKTEIHFHDLPCKVETKNENYITVKKELVKTENKNCGEFSKSEEKAIQYCLESMSPKDTKKRKIDSDLIVENDLPLEEVQQKIIEKLNILNQLHQSEIKDLRQRMSKNAFIIGKQSKELKFLIECKKELKIELDDIYHDLKILGEDKKEMELELNDVIGKLMGIS